MVLQMSRTDDEHNSFGVAFLAAEIDSENCKAKKYERLNNVLP